MSREIGALNLAEISADSLIPIDMAEFLFDEPVYAHSGIGIVAFQGKKYQGVGPFGGVSEMTESVNIAPSPLRLTLSGLDSNLMVESMDAGRHGDVIRLLAGFKSGAGVLVDSPAVVWEGWFDYATIRAGDENIIEIIAQNDLADLDKIAGNKYTLEEHGLKYSGDTFFKYLAKMQNLRLVWGGGKGDLIGSGSTATPGARGDRDGNNRDYRRERR